MCSARYRDLLGTAEAIVEMNCEIQQVEENLIGIGRKCNPREIEKKAEHLNRLRHDSSEKGLDYRRWDALDLALIAWKQTPTEKYSQLN